SMLPPLCRHHSVPLTAPRVTAPRAARTLIMGGATELFYTPSRQEGYMSPIRSICAAALVAGGLGGLALPAFAQSVEEVAAAYAVWDAAFNAGDAEAVGATYTADAIFLPATHDVIEGPAAISAFFDGLFGM